MGREWKPGDVAMVCLDAETEVRAMHSGAYWTGHKGAVYEPILSARPLVVIDYEDREAVERIADMVTQQVSDKDRSERMTIALAAALREFANPKPPKPEEPTGLGAVVEDAGGDLWVRVGPTIGDLHWRSTEPGNTNCFKWRAIDVVRVLSEGVVES